MEFSSQPYGKVLVFQINGRLDASTSSDLNQALSQTLSEGQPNLVFDLSGLDYTSSAGLRVILAAAQAARKQGGDVRLVAMKSEVKKVFDLSGLSSILQSFADVNSAVASF